jgi:hypothetical protein
MPSPQSTAARPASHDDIKAVLGNIDADKMQAIMALRPTITEVEAASLWLAGDADVYEPGEPLKGRAAAIVAIITEGEEEER